MQIGGMGELGITKRYLMEKRKNGIGQMRGVQKPPKRLGSQVGPGQAPALKM